MQICESYAGSNRVPALSMGPFQATRTGLVIFGTPPVAQWIAYTNSMLSITEGLLWIVGDALIWGEEHYPEAYEELIQSERYQPHTLSNAKWVAGRIDPQRRKDGLAWTMHEAVAGLEADAQDDLLEEAIEGDWTREELREAVKEAKGIDVDPFVEALRQARDAVRACVALADTTARIDGAELAIAILEDLV